MEFSKPRIYKESLKSNSLKEEDFDKYFKLLKLVMSELKDCRDDWSCTDLYLNSICSNNLLLNEMAYSMFMNWIYNAIKSDYTYIYTYNYIERSLIKKYNGINFIPHIEIDTFKLKKMLEQENSKRCIKYQINEDQKSLISLIYNICLSYKVIDCTDIDFEYYISNADFEDIYRVGIKYKVLTLINQLSYIMGKEWYKTTVRKIGKSTSDCTRKKPETSDKWMQEIDNLKLYKRSCNLKT